MSNNLKRKERQESLVIEGGTWYANGWEQETISIKVNDAEPSRMKAEDIGKLDESFNDGHSTSELIWYGKVGLSNGKSLFE